jgi:hypothetical protein
VHCAERGINNMAGNEFALVCDDDSRDQFKFGGMVLIKRGGFASISLAIVSNMILKFWNTSM